MRRLKKNGIVRKETEFWLIMKLYKEGRILDLV